MNNLIHFWCTHIMVCSHQKSSKYLHGVARSRLLAVCFSVTRANENNKKNSDTTGRVNKLFVDWLVQQCVMRIFCQSCMEDAIEVNIYGKPNLSHAHCLVRMCINSHLCIDIVYNLLVLILLLARTHYKTFFLSALFLTLNKYLFTHSLYYFKCNYTCLFVR